MSLVRRGSKKGTDEKGGDLITPNFLKLCREKAGFTRKEIIEKLYVSQGALYNWERGVYQPDMETLIKLSELYHVSLDMLVRGKEWEPNRTHGFHSFSDTNSSNKECD